MTNKLQNAFWLELPMALKIQPNVYTLVMDPIYFHDKILIYDMVAHLAKKIDLVEPIQVAVLPPEIFIMFCSM